MLKIGSWRCIVCWTAIYRHSDHETNITIEFTSKNGSWKCITLVCLPDLPYMVTLMKSTSPLNSHQKMIPEDVSHLCICWTCHIWLLWSWNRHHHWIHIEKWFLKMYHTCMFAGLAIYGHSDHETDITIEFTSKNGSWRCITLVFAGLAIYGHYNHEMDKQILPFKTLIECI